MHRLQRIISILIISILSLFAVALGDTPKQLNYQGSLSDDTGNPVPDGSFYMRFRLWTNPIEGEAVWDSELREVQVTNGLFNYNLGDTVPLKASTFQESPELWLGIKIGTDPEISPRTKLRSVGYAFEADHALAADYAYGSSWYSISNMPAGFADGIDDNNGLEIAYTDSAYINISGDVMTGALETPMVNLGIPYSRSGHLNLFSSTDAQTVVEAWAGGYGGVFRISGMGGKDFIRMETDVSTENGGYLSVARNSTPQIGFSIDGNFANTQQPRLALTGSSRSVTMDMSATGNASVSLPESAISSVEMQNEPGVAATNNGVTYTLNASSSTMQDLETITITIPADGYIVIDAILNVRAGEALGLNLNQTQIDEYVGGGIHSAYVNTWGGGGIIGDHEYSVPHRRLFYKTAGTYTFRVEGRTHPSNSSGVVAKVWSAWMTAIYIPTSYGVVENIVTDPGDYPSAEAITFEDRDGVSQSVYKVDLRDLEIRATRARLEAERLERELADLQTSQQNESADH